MKVICLRKSVSHGSFKLVRDQVSDEVPAAIVTGWIAAGYVREVSADAPAQTPTPAAPVRSRSRRIRP